MITNILSYNSDLMLLKHDQWINHIKPLFEKKFDKEYRYEYENMYFKEAKEYLKKQRKKFDKKFVSLIYLINEDDEILNSNLEWDDCILGLQDSYALFEKIEETEKYNYKKLGLITFLKE